MIQKRFEFLGPGGVKQWTEWRNYSPHDNLLKVFQKEEKYQLRSAGLLNEFRVV